MPFHEQRPAFNVQFGQPGQAGAERQPDEVGGQQAPERGDERGGNHVPQFVRLGQVFQDVGQGDDSSDDADGGGVTAEGREELRGGMVAARLRVDLILHLHPEVFGVGAVGDVLQGPGQEGIVDAGGFFLEGQQALAARLFREPDHLVDAVLRLRCFPDEHPRHGFEGLDDVLEGVPGQPDGQGGPEDEDHRARAAVATRGCRLPAGPSR